MADDIENTVYSKTVELMRNDPFFYKNQAMQGSGFIPIDSNGVQKGNSSSGMAVLFDKMQLYSGAPITHNYYYTYGWSGLLSPTVRYYDAKKLFEDLVDLVATFKKQNIEPKIRLIGYSHGGNVCLNLGAIHQYEYPESDLIVDELILLGMPVQNDTDYLVTDPIFKQIYHIYYYSDRIQRLDFFSFDRFFSRRTFRNRRRFKLPTNLRQIQLKVMRNTKNDHWSEKKQKAAKNFKKRGIITGSSNLLRDASPGHCELWFFGWTPLHYRKEYPLYPLPTISLTPYISYHIPKINHKLSKRHPIIFDIRPDQECILVKDYKGNKLRGIAPFLTHSEFDELAQLVLQFQPEGYTQKKYAEHIKDAYNAAVVLHEEQSQSKKTRRTKKKRHRKRRSKK